MAITTGKATKEEVEEAQEEVKEQAAIELDELPEKDVHQIMRGISVNGQFTQGGGQPASVVDAYLTEYLNRGYRLDSVHNLGISHFEGTPQPETYNFLYVMVKD